MQTHLFIIGSDSQAHVRGGEKSTLNFPHDFQLKLIIYRFESKQTKNEHTQIAPVQRKPIEYARN